MKLDVAWIPVEVERMAVHDRTAVVIDVLRASTSMVSAIHSGARAVVPAESIEEALRIARSIGRDQVVLGGERQGVRIEGFDLGNSPAEYAPDVVGGRTIVMTTTNGTRALLAAAGARRVFVASLVNLDAVASALLDVEGDLVIVCSGREGVVSADDALCAGLLVQAFLGKRKKKSPPVELGDGAAAAVALAETHGADAHGFIRSAAAARALERVGHGDDIEWCARIDSIPEVLEFRDRQIVAVDEPARVRATTRKSSRR